MKKRIFFKLVLSLGLCLAFIRCSDDIIDSTYAGSDDFSAEAQSYFERTAEDIRLPRMSARRYELTRSTDLSSEVITPRWRKQKTGKYGKGDISTVEVPLAGNIYRRGIYYENYSRGAKLLLAARVHTSLVIQKHHPSGEIRYFVTTVIEKQKSSWLNPRNKYDFGYTKRKGLNGLMVISDMKGRTLESFYFENGRQRRVRLVSSAEKEGISSSEIITVFRLLGEPASGIFTRSGEGGFDNGNGSTENPFCPLCMKLAKNCECHVEIVVPPLPEPPEEDPEGPEDPWRCIYCGSPYCSGSCTEGGYIPQPPPAPGDNVCPHVPCAICRKMIRLPEGTPLSQNCSFHEYCENEGMCIGVKVNISRSPVTLGDFYTITLDITPEDAECHHIGYYIVENGQEFVLPQEGGMSRTHTVMARAPGDFQIKAEVMRTGCDGVFSGSTNVKHLFPARNDIIKQRVFLDGVKIAWAKSLAAADAHGCREYGGVVMINTREDNTGGLYRFEHSEGAKTPYGTPLTTVDLKYTESHFGPNQGGEYCVLLFHTHFPLWNYKGSKPIKRELGPSSLDIENHTEIPAEVMDFRHPSGIIRHSTPKEEYVNTEKLYHYGPERRTKPIR